MAFRVDVAARAERHLAENVILDYGNGDPALGNYHPRPPVRLVSVVPALSSARGANALCDPRRRYPYRSGRKILGEDRVQEPRPFVVWLEKTHHVPVDEFYTLKRKDRGALVKEQLAEQQDIPKFLRKHWQKETGFAFPSGHTMFAASWALLGVGLLWPRRRTVTIVILLVWATGVMGSRLLLGMHWPRDLVVATLISWMLVMLATWLAERFCGPLTPPPEEKEEIAERDQTDA